jgi:hypothetical protein
VGFVKECGAMLQDLSPQGLHGRFFISPVITSAYFDCMTC